MPNQTHPSRPTTSGERDRAAENGISRIGSAASFLSGSSAQRFNKVRSAVPTRLTSVAAKGHHGTRHYGMSVVGLQSLRSRRQIEQVRF